MELYNIKKIILFHPSLQLEYLLHEKIKIDYFGIRKIFKDKDPEGRGTVSR